MIACCCDGIQDGWFWELQLLSWVDGWSGSAGGTGDGSQPKMIPGGY